MTSENCADSAWKYGSRSPRARARDQSMTTKGGEERNLSLSSLREGGEELFLHGNKMHLKDNDSM